MSCYIVTKFKIFLPLHRNLKKWDTLCSLGSLSMEITYIIKIYLLCSLQRTFSCLMDLVITKALEARHSCLLICKADNSHWTVRVKSSKFFLVQSLILEKMNLPLVPKTPPLLILPLSLSLPPLLVI